MREFFKLPSIVLFALVVSVFAGCGGGSSQTVQHPPTPTQYTVTFNSNSGSAVASRQVQKGGALSAPNPPPTREGYNFDGWYSDSSLTKKVDFPYTVTGNITLYAKWTLIQIQSYQISTPAHLNNVRNDLSGRYTLTADISLSSYANWNPIGSDGAPFTGKIDGNGHKITGLKINRIEENYAGLFGYVSGGEIINLTLENVDIVGGVIAGGIAAVMENSTITNCRSTGIIAGVSAGGITGHADNSTITNCNSAVNVYVGYYSGGIAGIALNSTIMDCHSTGNITAELFAGGITGGQEGGSITGSYNTGNVMAELFAGGITGGLADGTITGSYNTGSIRSNSNIGSITDQAAGGIAGYAVLDSAITDSYNEGYINSSSNSGGITGQLWDSAISNCYNTGDINAESSSGGIAGYVNNGTTTNCYNKGNDIRAVLSAGGIAGYIEDGAITNCYSTGNIHSRSFAGGIVGSVLNSAITNCAAKSRKIIAAFYAGRIASYIWDTASITNNFALDTMDANGEAKFDDADAERHGISKTGGQLEDKTTYSDDIIDNGMGGLGWKFGNNDAAPWTIPDGGGNPILYWQEIEISTPAQLYNVRNYLSGYYKLTADISLETYANWEPIGTESAPFTGAIAGNGYKITGLTINREIETYVGLFGYVGHGTINNLALEDVNIVGGSYVGAIAGFIEYSNITNSYSTGDIFAYFSHSGGIAGFIQYSTITNSYSTGNISDMSSGYRSYSGGIAGYVQYSIITNSYSSGNIFSYGGNASSGGIAGYVYDGIITNSYSSGNIFSYGENASSGGIAGYVNDGIITNIYSTGDVYSDFSGGIAGIVSNGTITNCYSTGDVYSYYDPSYSIFSSYSGGITGHGYNYIITNCAAINNNITAKNSAGRIVGFWDIYGTPTVSNNFALNTMTAAGDAQFNDTDIKSHGTDKTDAQLKTKSTYSDAVNGDGLGSLGWKFGNDDDAPWKMPSAGDDYPYPILYWQ